MKYLIFSDSHGRVQTMRAALAAHGDAHGIIFLGDGLRDLDLIKDKLSDRAVIKVRGNCDAFTDLRTPTISAFTVDGIRVAAMHGHEQQVKYTDARLERLAEEGYDLILHGHTHMARERHIRCKERVCVICNPGTAAKGEFAVLTVQNGQFLISLGAI